HTPTELRLAYRRAAFNAHPDRGGSTEALKRINAAYELLGGRQAAGGFAVDVDAVDPRGSARKRQAHAPMPRDREAQQKVLFQCQSCLTVFVGGGLAVEFCCQKLPDGSVCRSKNIERYPRTGHSSHPAHCRCPDCQRTRQVSVSPRPPSRLGDPTR